MTRTKSKNNLRQWPISIWFGGGTALLILLVVAVYLATGGWPTQEEDSTKIATEEITREPDSTYPYVSEPILLAGRSSTSDTITLFEDFHCSACATLSSEFLSGIERRFVSTGQAKIEYRHFVHYGDDSLIAAQAAECVYEQDVAFGTERIRELHDQLFATQSEQFAPRLTQLATRAGVQDLDAFSACVETEKYLEKIRSSTAWITERGAQGTPTVQVKTVLFVGVPSLGALEQALNENIEQE